MRDSDAEPYSKREQTQAKHFILRRYLEKLAYKILTFSELTYVDGFSGPWKTETEDFSDSSFMIAISVLRGVQKTLIEQRGKCRRIRCFFSEVDAKAISQLRAAVGPYHDPQNGFEICTFHGEFEDAVPEIQRCVGRSFALIFIDPTGWTGYPFDKIKSLFSARKYEVLINFMYDHINRFSGSDDEKVILSLSPILGGPDWPKRLDASLPRGAAVEKLFRETGRPARVRPGSRAHWLSRPVARATRCCTGACRGSSRNYASRTAMVATSSSSRRSRKLP